MSLFITITIAIALTPPQQAIARLYCNHIISDRICYFGGSICYFGDSIYYFGDSICYFGERICYFGDNIYYFSERICYFGDNISHILHLEILMSKPQLSVRGINRSISSKRRDTT
ncbi:MAG: hypothetical protein V7K47_19380, partial [Nostoc sp.]